MAMKRLFLPLMLFSLLFANTLKAQVIDVYAGNDTIELRVGNYQYGFVQWQTSKDTENWDNIEGATDTIYRFLPTENAYYRALAFFENCPDVTSKVCYVQVPPKADAGPDRKLSEGSGATMFALMGEGCVGEWEIIEGANGVLDDPSSPNAYFEGTDTEYKLKWTVTNACGSDSDTITISYRHTVLNENYIVVDTTDVVLSDSTQLLNGRYLIAFSEPVTLNDSMLLCGVGENGFLRKIVSYTYDPDLDVYDIETEQASVEDFLIDGVLSFDLNAMMRHSDKVFLSHSYPTRKDIAKIGFDGLYFKLPDSSDASVAWDPGQKKWKMNWFAGPMSLPGYIIIDPSLDIDLPDIIFEIEKDFLEVTYLKVGMQFDYHYALRFGLPDGVGYTMFKEDFPLFGPINFPPFYLGPVSFHGKWDVTLDYKATCTLDTKMTFELSSDGKLNYYVLYDPSAPQQWTTHHGIDPRPMELKMIDKPFEYADISFRASLGTGISLMIYNVVGPYAKLAVVAEEKFNIFGDGFNSGEFRLGLDLIGGVKAQIRKKKFFDWKFTLPLLTFLEYKDPASIHLFSGNHQTFMPDNHLPNPIAVQLRNSRGKPSSGTKVKFETSDGYFTQDKVFTNSDGIAYTNWICGNNPSGVVNAKAYSYNYKHEPIEYAPVLFKAYHGNSSISDCFNSNLAVTADVSSGYLRPKANGGQGGYSYSTDGLIFTPYLTPIIPVGGQTYHFYVKDAFDCVAECYYTHPSLDCFSSGLQLRVEQQGNTVTAYASGGAGGGGGSWKDLEATEDMVYEYRIDDGSFSSNNVFTGLTDGRHVVYVRDANGCEEAKVFTVETGSCNIGGTGDDDEDGVAVTTSSVNVMAADMATCGGSVSISGTAFVTRYGICWSTHHGPTTSNDYVQHAYNGTTFSNYLMTNLSSGVAYYVRAFAVTNTGTVYGNEVGFSTTAVAPVVTTTGVGNVTTTTAKVYGNVSNINGTTVTERGMCWSTGHNPTVSGSHIACGAGTGAFTADITNLISGMRYYVRAYATNSMGTGYGEEKEFTTNGNGGGGSHEYVDLGLPSGTLWATCNIGANAPEENGGFFAWGETIPKDDCNWSDYQYCNGSYNTLTRYCNDPEYGFNGFTDDLTVLLPEDDVATVNWGADWRMPTKGEWVELEDYTELSWTTQNGVNGALFTASNGNSIFLPFNGSNIIGSWGNYWSSSLYTDYPVEAWYYTFYSPPYGDNYIYDHGRTGCCNVRPIVRSNNLPQVTTSEVSHCTNSTATCGGAVVSGGGSIVLERGVCWSTDHNPTLNDSHNYAGMGVGDFKIGAVGLSPATTYYVRAYATNNAGTVYGNEVEFTTAGNSSVSTHEYVDLGLPSGTLWAICNLGANAPEEHGDYFAWGEIIPKDCYDWNTYQYCVGGSDLQMTKYSNSTDYHWNYGYTGFTDDLNILLPEDDAATVNWGEDWRMPTKEEWFELFHYTTYTSTGHGALLTAANGNSIFLPAAGVYAACEPDWVHVYGYYWSSTHRVDYSDSAYNSEFRDGSWDQNSLERLFGCSVRAVRVISQQSYIPQVNTYDVTDFTSSSAVCGGEVVSDNGMAVTERGICWSTSPNPTLDDNHVSAGTGMGAFTVNITGLSPATAYYVRAYAINAAGTAYGNEVSFPTFGGGDNHAYVDLGLPSGTLWATCNVGANAPEEYGDYFAWGEIQTKDIEFFSWHYYKYCYDSSNTLTKYCNNSEFGYNGFVDDLTTLLPGDDAASINWGADWRIPTKEEWEELYQNTTYSWTNQNGVRGVLFSGSNGQSIFIPAAGCLWSSSSYNGLCFYWTNSLYSVDPSKAWYLGVDSNGCGMYNGYHDRDCGRSVRPVRSSHRK